MSRIRRLIGPLFLLAVSCAAQQPADLPKEPPKKLVVVLDFDNRIVESDVYSIYGSQQNVGRGVTNLLVEKLLKDGQYRIVDRKALDNILAEQNDPIHILRDPDAMARLGKLAGLDAVIMGSVIRFDREEIRITDDMRLRDRAMHLARLKKGELRAVCAVNARLVDTSTGEILASVAGEGKSEREGTSLFSGGFLSPDLLSGGLFTRGNNPNKSAGPGFDIHDPAFEQTLIGEAVTKAVNALGTELDARATTMANHKQDISGTVADVSDSTLIVNVGNKNGLNVGDKLEITRIIRLVVDPKTGKILKPVTNSIGEGTVTEINTEFATLSFSGSSTAKVGDIARTHYESQRNHAADGQQQNATLRRTPNADGSLNNPAAGDDPAAGNDNPVSYSPH